MSGLPAMLYLQFASQTVINYPRYLLVICQLPSPEKWEISPMNSLVKK